MQRRSFPFCFFILVSLILPLVQAGAESTGGEELRTSDTGLEKGSASGPWGYLEYSSLYLEPPESTLRNSSFLLAWKQYLPWKFAASSVEEVREILIAAGLEQRWFNELEEFGSILPSANDGYFSVLPPEELVTQMTAGQRLKLYPMTRPSVADNLFLNPFPLLDKGMLSSCYRSADISTEQRNLVERLSFRKGDAVFFSDLGLVMQHATDDSERLGLLKTIFRERSYSVELVFQGKRSFEELSRYWGAGERNSGVQPVLRSLVNNPEIQSIDLVHLLPPLPRKLLNTYPSDETESVGGEWPDCFWTAFSFFADDPQERFLDTVRYVGDERYETVSGAPQFGDVVFIGTRGGERIMHACNYLAGDLVFSKNGQTVARPWVICSLDEAISGFGDSKTLEVKFLRLKPGYLK